LSSSRINDDVTGPMAAILGVEIDLSASLPGPEEWSLKYLCSVGVTKPAADGAKWIIHHPCNADSPGNYRQTGPKSEYIITNLEVRKP
jgi:hypothetical protein